MKEHDATRDAAIRRSSQALAGEGLEYFAHYKLRVLQRVLGRAFSAPLLDYGCGLGDFTRLLAQTFDDVHGYDPSAQAVELASKRTPRATFHDDPDALPRAHYGAVVLAGVLRHVPPENRPGLMRNVAALLARGGKLVVFEHNALHPVMRRVVRELEGDGAHIPTPWEIRRLIKDAGLGRRSLEFIVFFPRALSWLRPLEAAMGRVPAGAQVVAWGEKR